MKLARQASRNSASRRKSGPHTPCAGSASDTAWIKGNANFAWVPHFIHHLAPQAALCDSAFLQSEAKPQVMLHRREAKNNMAGFVLANGATASLFSCKEGVFKL